MDDTRRYLRLGLFVIVCLAGLAAGLSVLGWRFWFQPAFMFETYFNQSISGLALGAPVSFRGVPLGQVVEIVTSAAPYESTVPIEDRHDYIVVRVKVSLSADAAAQMKKDIATLIKRGLRAQTQLAGITGQQYLELDFMDPKKFPPLPFSWKPESIYVPSAPSVAGDIIEKAQSFLASLDAADVSRLSRSLDRLVEHLDTKLGEVPVTELARRLEGVLDGADATLRRVDRLLADPALRETLDHAAAITARLQAITDSGELENLIAQTSAAAARLDAVLADNQYDVREIVSDLRVTSERLRELSRSLDRDPAGTLLGGPPPRIQLPEHAP